MAACWGGRVLAVDGSAARDTHGVPLHEHWSAGRPRRAWPPSASARLALTDSTHSTPHPVQTGVYACAPHAPAVVRLPGLAWWQRHVRDRTRECDAPAWQRTRAALMPVAAPAVAHPPRRPPWSPAFTEP